MANADVLATTTYAAFLEGFYQDNIWTSLLSDRTAQMEGYNYKLDLTYDETSRTLTSKTRANLISTTLTDVARPDPVVTSLAKRSLEYDKFYTVRELLPALLQVFSRPSVANSVSFQNARAFREKTNEELRATLAAAANAQKHSPITVSSGNWGNAAHMTAVDNAMRKAAVNANGGSWPMNRSLVTSVDMADIIERIVEGKNLHFQSNINDEAAARGVVGHWRGFEIIPDASAGTGTSNSDDAKHDMFFGIRGLFGVYCMDFLEPLQIDPRSSTHVGSELTGTAMWGSVISEPSKIQLVETSIT